MKSLIASLFFILFLSGCFGIGSNIEGVSSVQTFPYKADDIKTKKIENNIGLISIGKTIEDVINILGSPDVELFANKNKYLKYDKIEKTYIYYVECSKNVENSYRIYFDFENKVLGMVKIDYKKYNE